MKFKGNKKILELAAPFTVFCRKNKKTVVLICVCVLLIALLSFVSDLGQNGCYVKDKHGRVTALRLEEKMSENGIATFPIEVEGEKNGVKTRTELHLTFGQGQGKDAGLARKETPEQALRSLLKDTGRQVEEQEAEKGIIFLPQKLEDGTVLTWTSSRTTSVPAILMLLPLALGFLYQSQREREKTKQRQKVDDVKRQLPGFNNQLLLLLGSGLIFSDAFNRIAEGCKARKKEGYLAETIVDIAKEAEETGSNLVTVLGRYSKKLGIREFSRLTGIITDNQYKGVNLTDKLESESEILWNARKKAAEEKGRTAETKLAFPLAILLLALILITAAPAVLQM